MGKNHKSKKTGSRISFTLWDDDDMRVFEIRKEPVKKAKAKIKELMGFKL